MSDAEEQAAEAAARALEESTDSPTGGASANIMMLTPFWRALVVLLMTFTDLVTAVMKNAVTLFLAILAGMSPFLMNYLEGPDQEAERTRQHEQRMEDKKLIDSAMTKLSDELERTNESLDKERSRPPHVREVEVLR